MLDRNLEIHSHGKSRGSPRFIKVLYFFKCRSDAKGDVNNTENEIPGAA
jgi:hypothetical protein